MTDALVEAVAKAISGQDDAGWKALPQDDRERLYGGGKWHDSGHTRDDHKQSATAALQAIEAAGYRVVPVKATRELRVAGEKEMMARHCLHFA